MLPDDSTLEVSAEFLRAVGFSLLRETGGRQDGGYTDDPTDPGGETKWGVSKQSYPGLDILHLTREQAVELFYRDYWLSTGPQQSYCDVMPAPLCTVHFDCVMNVGNLKTVNGKPFYHGNANKILQRALGVKDDGHIGPITLAAIQSRDPQTLARDAMLQREEFYKSLTHLAHFLDGWIKRTELLAKFCNLSLETQ